MKAATQRGKDQHSVHLWVDTALFAWLHKVGREQGMNLSQAIRYLLLLAAEAYSMPRTRLPRRTFEHLSKEKESDAPQPRHR